MRGTTSQVRRRCKDDILPQVSTHNLAFGPQGPPGPWLLGTPGSTLHAPWNLGVSCPHLPMCTSEPPLGSAERHRLSESPSSPPQDSKKAGVPRAYVPHVAAWCEELAHYLQERGPPPSPV